MSIRFFSLSADRYLREFISDKEDIVEGSNSEGEATESGISQSDSKASEPEYSYRQLRFLPPEKTPEELLEILLKKIANASGFDCNYYLQQLMELLARHKDLVNSVSKTFDSNPLELIVSLGHFEVALALQSLGAQIRPDNYLLQAKLDFYISKKFSYERIYHHEV